MTNTKDYSQPIEGSFNLKGLSYDLGFEDKKLVEKRFRNVAINFTNSYDECQQVPILF